MQQYITELFMFGKAEWKQKGDSSDPCSCFYALALLMLKYSLGLCLLARLECVMECAIVGL